jgi:succinoglycan biosynthesis transport protein ExoP
MMMHPSRPQYLDAVAPPDSASREVDPRRILSTLWRRRWLIAIVFVAFVAFVAAFTSMQHKQYSTEVKLIVGEGGNSSSTTSLPILNALLAASGSQSNDTYAELIQQAPVAAEVIQRLGLQTGVGTLMSHIVVKPVTGTAIIGVRVSWSDPDTAAKVANMVASVFVDRQRQLVASQADAAIGFLEQQIPDAQLRMQAAQNALVAYQARVGIADLPTQTNADIQTLAGLDSKESQAELDIRQAQSQLAAVQSAMSETPSTIVSSTSISSNPLVSQLQSQISNLEGQLEAARQTYTDAHPTVIGLRAQIAEAEAQLRSLPAQVTSGSSVGANPIYSQLQSQATQLAGTLAGARATVATIKAQREKFRPKLAQLPERARRISDLQRESTAAQGLYQALEQKYQEAVISKTTALSDVSITQAAEPNNYTVTPNVQLNLQIAAVIGLGLALSAAFLAELLDDRFRSEEDVKERFGLPVLAAIPAIDSNDWRANQWVKPLSVEAFYQLVASLRYSAGGQAPRTIALVSPEQGDGKSTVAVNTAISMGLMRAKVLIVDADLRRPTIHQKLNIPNDRGLSDVLVGLARFPDVIKPSRHAGVSVLTAGRPAPNPVGLLQSAAFDRLLKKARERFDYIIIDGPALRGIVDGAVLAHKAEGTVMVVSSQRSDARTVQTALEKLRMLGSAHLLGLVLNGVKLGAARTNDYYVGVEQSIPLPRTSNVG